MRGPSTLILVILLALSTTTCSSSADNKPADAAADGEGDCQRKGCTDDLECRECLGQDGDPVFVCVPPDSAC